MKALAVFLSLSDQCVVRIVYKRSFIIIDGITVMIHKLHNHGVDGDLGVEMISKLRSHSWWTEIPL